MLCWAGPPPAGSFFDVRFGVRGACPLSEFADVWISRLGLCIKRSEVLGKWQEGGQLDQRRGPRESWAASQPLAERTGRQRPLVRLPSRVL